jgi:hypothetical protein
VRIFLSHATADREVIAQVKLAVGSLATVYCTEDDNRAGVNVHKKVQREIDKSDFVIALLTKEAAVSSYVHHELGWAQKAGKLIIPVISGEVSPKDLAMLEGIEYINIDDSIREAATVGIVLVVLGVLLFNGD